MSATTHSEEKNTETNPFDALSPEDQEILSEILEGYLADLERGEQLEPSSLIEQYPRFESALQWYLESLSFLNRAAEQLGSETSAGSEPTEERRELGDFEILREVGRGGMGIVYEAKQKSLGRQVALKVLPFAAVLDQKQIARFRNEAQAAAQLQHDNIVPVHSVGTDRGVHYYSMQFIEGQSLDRAIEELQNWERAGQAIADVSTERRVSFSTNRSFRSRDHICSVVELVVQAAEALQHAHEFGVVHRDIKPSNLLIDRLGKLWVTDFGLARCQSSTTITMTGDLLGTVRYMSPEAAAGRGHLVDHLSDLYSLGVTLYELLTLTPPHDQTDRTRLLDAIRDQEPPSPRTHNAAIPVDLETIVLKAISKQRDQRYESCQAFADDLRRFLEGKPTLAKRPTVWDRAAKWASRRRRLVASTVCVLAMSTVIAFAMVTLLLAERRKTDAALAESEANFKQSQANLGKAIEVVDRFGLRLASELSGIPGAESVRRRVLKATLEDFRKFASQMQEDAAMSRALALCQTQIAAMHRQLGEFDAAAQRYRSAIELYEQLDVESSGSQQTALHHELAVCFNNLGELLFQQGDIDAAVATYERGLSLARELSQGSPSGQHRHLLSATLVNYGNLRRATNSVPDAILMYEEAIGLQKKLCAEEPESVPYQRELAVSYAQLAYLRATDNLDEADRLNRESIKIHQGLVEADPENLAALSELATCYNHRGAIYARNGKVDEAQQAHRRGMEIQSQLVLRAPSVARFKEQLAVGHNNLGQMLMSSGGDHVIEATRQFEQAQSILTELVNRSPQSPHFRAQLGGVLANLAPILEKTDAARALGLYRAAITHQQAAVERSPEILDFRMWLSSSYVKYSAFLRGRGDADAAGAVTEWRRDLWQEDAEHLFRVAREFAQTAKVADATEQQDKWAEQAVETWRRSVQLGLKDVATKRDDPAFASLRENLNENLLETP